MNRNLPRWPRRTRHVCIVAALSVTALAACGDDDDSAESTSARAPSSASPTTAAADSSPATEAPATTAAESASAAESTSETTPSASTSAAESTTSVEGVTSAVAEYLENTFAGTVPADKFEPYVLHAFDVAASNPLTDEQQDTLFKCLSEATCEIGPGELTMGYVESNALNPIRRVQRMEAIAQALAYPEVGKIIYTDAGGDLSTFISNFRSLIAQNVDLVFVNSDFGAATLEVTKEAMEAGIKTVIIQGIPGAEEGVDYDVLLGASNACAAWTESANRAIEVLGKDKTYALYTGVPGNAYAGAWQPCWKQTVEAAGWKEVFNGTTDWTPQGTQQAAAALLASGTDPDAIVYDYSPANFIQPYLDAGETPPAFFVAATNAVDWKQYQQAQADGVDFPVYIQAAAGGYTMRPGISAGIEKALGMDGVPSDITTPWVLAQLKDVVQNYDPALPDLTPMVSDVPVEWVVKALSAS